MTLAITFVSIIATHYFSLTTIGLKEYIGRYLSLNPINLFVGILEVIGEFTKIISLSFRLFGNIFAGEVLLATIGSIFAFVLPVPFLLLEVLVGVIQATVFSMLTMVFMSMLMTPHSDGAHA
jgi:F-type H+-transporting ATPase subunit a